MIPPGMRGFGASDEQKAVIEFGKPLTLITGQNGAGKTVSPIPIPLSSGPDCAWYVDCYRVSEVCNYWGTAS